MRRLLLVLPLLLLACDSNDTPTFIEPTDLSTFSNELEPLIGSWRLVKSISFGFGPQRVATGDDLPRQTVTFFADSTGFREYADGTRYPVTFNPGRCGFAGCDPNSLDTGRYPFGTKGDRLIVFQGHVDGPEEHYERIR